MKRNITIAALSMNLGMALMAVCLVAGSDSILAMGGALLWLASAAWLCKRYSHLIPEDKD